MKRISLHRIGESSRRAAARFPLVLLVAAAAAAAGVLLVKDDDSVWLQKLLLIAQLGIPLLLAARVATETKSFPVRSAASAWAARGIAGLLLAAYYFVLPTSLGQVDFVRHIQLNLAAHLAVAVAPFLQPGKSNAFWQYNLGLALRLLASLFFSAVLCTGLSVALVSLDMLLGLTVDGSVYPQLWLVILFLFNTWYFMAGIPERPHELESVTTLPAIVRVFAQFILAPLVMVYLAILSAYQVKILATAEWPSGQIGYLVSSVAVAGIFSLLLLYPLSVRTGVRWVRIYARTYYILLAPAVILLLMAIGQRIGQYGVTENRYLLTVLALWLAGVVGVGVLRGRPLLKVIPVTLAVIAIITAYGPLSAAQMSRRSQLGRLDALLSSHERLVDGRIVTASAPVSQDDGREIRSILSYLFENHGPRVLGGRVDDSMQESLDREATATERKFMRGVEMSGIVARHIDLPAMDLGMPTNHWVEKEQGPRAVGLGGYDYAIELEFPRDNGWKIPLGEHSLRLTLGEASSDLTVMLDDSTRFELGVSARLLSIGNSDISSSTRHVVPDSLMQVNREYADLRLMLLIASAQWQEEGDKPCTISDLRGVLLVELKD
jgi:Domain of unknown function (DUF4153)